MTGLKNETMMDEKYIRQQIERFLDGMTSNAEEQELYRYFASDDVPGSLRQYREMFRWYAGGMQTSLPRRSRVRRMWFRVGVAASFLALVGIGFGWYRHQERAELYSLYEGSYIVRDGKKITDISQILPELQKQEREAMRLSWQIDHGTYELKNENLPVI